MKLNETDIADRTANDISIAACIRAPSEQRVTTAVMVIGRGSEPEIGLFMCDIFHHYCSQNGEGRHYDRTRHVISSYSKSIHQDWAHGLN